MLQSTHYSGGAFGKRRPEKGQVHEELTMPQRQPTIPYPSGRSGAASLCDPARFDSRLPRLHKSFLRRLVPSIPPA